MVRYQFDGVVLLLRFWVEGFLREDTFKLFEVVWNSMLWGALASELNLKASARP